MRACQAGPVLLVERVLDGDQRVGVEQLAVVGGHLGGRPLLALEGVAAVGVELGGGHVERERDVAAGSEAGLADRLEDEVERRAVAGQLGGEAALVAEPGVQALGLQHRLQRVVGLGTPPHRLGERARADRRDHELLDVDVGVGVRAAVEDVHHRYRQQVRVGAAHVAVQRLPGEVGGGPCDGEAHAEDRVGAELGLVGGAVEVDQDLVDQPLLVGRKADDLLVDQLVDGLDRLGHALTAVALAPVAQLDGLEPAGGGAARDGGAGLGPVGEQHFDLNGRVASGVQDLPGKDGVDRRHGQLPVQTCSVVFGSRAYPRAHRRAHRARRTQIGRPPRNRARQAT